MQNEIEHVNCIWQYVINSVFSFFLVMEYAAHRVYVRNLRWDVEKPMIRQMLGFLDVQHGLQEDGVQLCRKEKIGATYVFSVVCMFDG